MSLAKQAQGFSVSMNPDQAETLDYEAPKDMALAMDEPLFSIDEDHEDQLLFILPHLPGSTDQSDFVGPTPDIEVEDDEIIIDDDPWKWDVSSFMKWLSGMMKGVPSHSGYASTGVERALAYLEALDREISKAVRMDLKNEIAVEAVEKAREEIHKGIESLHVRHKEIMESKYPKRKSRKKKSDSSDGLIKEGTKATRINGITITVPLIVSYVARTCINSMVSAGKDIEDTFEKLAKKFDFNDREEVETIQLMADMGYAIRRPRGFLRDEDIDYTSTQNHDWVQNFPA